MHKQAENSQESRPILLVEDNIIVPTLRRHCH